MKIRLIAVTLLGLVLGSGVVPCFGLDATTLQHVPPQIGVGEGDDREFSIPAAGVRRCRMLIEDVSGYQMIEMKKGTGQCLATVAWNHRVELRYRFQVETEDDHIFESDRYTVQRSLSSDSAEELRAREREYELLQAKVLQLENALQGLKATDPKQLAKQKNMELARALVVLSRREREVAAAEREAGGK